MCSCMLDHGRQHQKFNEVLTGSTKGTERQVLDDDHSTEISQDTCETMSGGPRSQAMEPCGVLVDTWSCMR